MASLTSTANLGGGSASSLVKSAATLQNELAANEDNAQKITWDNSGYTDAAFQAYSAYLQSRVSQLQATGSITDQTKALTMGQEIVTATHSNISYHIQQENTALISQGDAGTVAGYQSKMNVLAQQFETAQSIGDTTLADQLESQYYSTSQSLQNAQATAATASDTLAKAGASTQAGVVTQLNDAVTALNDSVKANGVGELNKFLDTTSGVNGQSYGSIMQTLGVKLPDGAAPNYFDLLNGVMGAKYNAEVLTAQAYAPYDPNTAQTHLDSANELLTNQATISTLAGSMTGQQIQEAAANPDMYLYDAGTGKYSLSAQQGYQYETFTNPNGQQYQTLVPQYSGIQTDAQRNKTVFLNPQQTKEMTALGLNFTDNKSGTTGDGVSVQASTNTPLWLQNILNPTGEGDTKTQIFTQPKGGNGLGGLVFAAADPKSGNLAEYQLVTDASGKAGLYMNDPATGSYAMVGGAYGFNANAINLLINNAQQEQQLGAAHTAAAQAALKTAAPIQLPKITVAPNKAAPPTVAPQPAATASLFQPAAPGKTIQNAPNVVQNTTSGPALNQSGTGGIKLNAAPLQGIKL